jgi:hypothetical protein
MIRTVPMIKTAITSIAIIATNISTSRRATNHGAFRFDPWMMCVKPLEPTLKSIRYTNKLHSKREGEREIPNVILTIPRCDEM